MLLKMLIQILLMVGAPNAGEGERVAQAGALQEGWRVPPLLLFAAAASQQAPAAGPAPEIVVTGRGLADAPGDRAFDIVTIDRARIAANAADRLESVLADAAGLQQFRRGDSRSANQTSQD